MKNTSRTRKVIITYALINIFASYFVCARIIGADIITIIYEMMSDEEGINEYGRFGGGPEGDLLMAFELWVLLMLPTISSILLLNENNLYKICAVVFQIPFLIMFCLQVFFAIYNAVYIVVISVLGEKEDMHVAWSNLPIMLSVELWFLVPTGYLVWEKLKGRWPRSVQRG